MRRSRILTRVVTVVIALTTALAWVFPAVAAPSVSVNIDQWANGTTSTSPIWRNGDINGNNSTYVEGDVVPFRVTIEGLTATPSPHAIDISYNYASGGPMAYDFLATWNVTENPDLCASGGGAVSSMCPNLGSALTTAFPTDSSGEIHNAEVAFGSNRKMTVYGATSASISSVTYDTSKGTATITVSFNVPDSCSQTPCAVLLAWGGHLARTSDYTEGGSGQITGAPWHMYISNLDGSGTGTQARGIQDVQGQSTPTPTVTVTPTNTPTNTPTPTSTVPPGSTATPTPTNTAPPASTATPTATPTHTAVPSQPAPPTNTPKPSNPPPSSSSSSPPPTATNTPTPTHTATPVPPTKTATPRPTQVAPLILPRSGGIAPIVVEALGGILLAAGFATHRRLRRK